MIVNMTPGIRGVREYNAGRGIKIENNEISLQDGYDAVAIPSNDDINKALFAGPSGAMEWRTITVPSGSGSGGSGGEGVVYTAGEGITINENVISADIQLLQGATSESDGAAGLVPPPSRAQKNYFLRGDGQWAETSGENYYAGDGITIDSSNEISVGIPVLGDSNSENAEKFLVPPPDVNEGEIAYLCSDGTWGIPSGGSGSSNLSYVEISDIDDSEIYILKDETSLNISYTVYSYKPNEEHTIENLTNSKLKAFWSINGVIKHTQINLSQGIQTFDILRFLDKNVSENIIALRIEDKYGSFDLIEKKVKILSYSISWNLRESDYYNNAASILITVNGASSAVQSNTQQINVTINSDSLNEPITTGLNDFTPGDGSQVSYSFSPPNGLTHGAFTLMIQMQFKITGNDTFFYTNKLTHTGIWTDWTDANNQTIIAIIDAPSEMIQYGTYPIKYRVISKELTTNIRLYSGIYDNNNPVTPITVNRDVQTWNFTANSAGSIILTVEETINNGSSKSITIPCAAISGVSPEGGYRIDFRPSEGKYYYKNDNSYVTADIISNVTFSNNFSTDLNEIFRTDEDGTALVVPRGTRATLPFGFFENDIGASGREFKIIFKIVKCTDYDTEVLNCKTNTTGVPYFTIGAQKADLYTGSELISAPYCEDSKIELDVNINGNIRVDDQIIDRSVATIWLEGVPSRAIQYSIDNKWNNGLNEIQIGSDFCEIWIYRIKIYENSLSNRKIINNFIADCGNPAETQKRLSKNNIYNDDNDNINIDKLAANNPDLRIIIIELYRMTSSKNDKVHCGVELKYRGNSFKIPINETVAILQAGPNAGQNESTIKNAWGARVRVQGTSSAAYGDSAYNLDLDFSKNGGMWKDGNQNTISSFSMTENDIPVNYFTLKLNVASSENANNVILANRYNRYQPFQTAARTEQYGGTNWEKVRDTIKGYPCAIFIKNCNNVPISAKGPVGSDVLDKARIIPSNTTIFYGCGDMCNSKKNFEVFGQTKASEGQCCIEFKDNLDHCTFLTSLDELDSNNELGINHFELRYPDYKNNEAEAAQYLNHFKIVHDWVYSTKRSSASNLPLNSPVEINGITYENDTQEYRLAKFKKELPDYFSVDSLLYHYLFTERHCMVDNRAKNVFFSFELDPNFANEQSSVTGVLGYRWNVCKDYDNDTADGNDNEGGLTLTYGLDDLSTSIDNSTNVAAPIFNAANSVLWCNLRDAFSEELSAMYNKFIADGLDIWNSKSVIEEFQNYQSARPEALVAEDMYNKYLRIFINYNDPYYIKMLQGNKTDQRKQFETYEDVYFKSKHCNRNTLIASSYSTWRNGRQPGLSSNYTMTVVPYINCKIAISVNEGVVKRVNAIKGVPCLVPIYSSSTPISSDFAVETFPANYISELTGLANNYFRAPNLTNATRLKVFSAGSLESGYNNSNVGDGFNINGAIGLEEFDINNWSQFAEQLDFTNMASLKKLAAINTKVANVILPEWAPLTTVFLQSPSKIYAHNLLLLEDGISLNLNNGLIIQEPEKLSEIDVSNVPSVKRWLEYAIRANEQGNLQKCNIIGMAQTNNPVYLSPEGFLNLLNKSSLWTEGRTLEGVCYVQAATKAQRTAINNKIGNGHDFPNLSVIYESNENIVSYNVSFVNEDGSLINGIDSQTVRSGRCAIRPEWSPPDVDEVTINGHPHYRHHFDTWRVGSTEGIVYNFNNPVTNNLVLYASYVNIAYEYTVNFISEDGSSIHSEIAKCYFSNGVWHYGSVRYNGRSITINDHYTENIPDDTENIIFAGWHLLNENTLFLDYDNIYDNMTLKPYFLEPLDYSQLPSGTITSDTEYLYSDDILDTSRYTLQQLYTVLLQGAEAFQSDPNTTNQNQINLHNLIKIKLIKPLDNNGRPIQNSIIPETELIFELAGCGDYYQKSDNSEYTSWIFLLKYALSNPLQISTEPITSPFTCVNDGGWENTNVRQELNGGEGVVGIYDLFPQHWKALIKKVRVKSNKGFSSSSDASAMYNANEEEVDSYINTSDDYLFLLSPVEIGWANSYWGYIGDAANPRLIYLKETDSQVENGSLKGMLPIFLNGAGYTSAAALSRIRFTNASDANTTEGAYGNGSVTWLLRSPYVSGDSRETSTHSFCGIGGRKKDNTSSNNGYPSSGEGSAGFGNIPPWGISSGYILFAFCI